ncbi:pirin family protein [Haliea sp. E17]|uniref:pirin family protein n=1 Tax=Haliea sp. E17 TaxID=3401576 RepID=UPI003AADCD2B
MTQRKVIEVRPAQPSRDGDGVAIARIVGMGHAGMDPILMLDELRSTSREDFIGGFPPHPHRGMQTLTYMKRGGIIHQDSQGNRGEIRGGGAQWMSAARGVIHSEMPTPDTGELHGFQIWVNLPAVQKMAEPQYRDVPEAELSHLEGAGFRASAIAGHWDFGPGGEVTGPLQVLAEVAGLLDLQLAPGASVELALADQENVLAYVYDGAIATRDGSQPAGRMLVTSAGDRWPLTAGEQGAGLILLRGIPLREPIAHYGPFVMNTSEEIEQAIRDYQEGRLGVAPAA